MKNLIIIFFTAIIGISNVHAQVKKSTVKRVGVETTINPRQTLSRGEFAIQFNSSLESLRTLMDSLKLDTSLINTYDRNRSYVTSVSEIKDVSTSSPYYTSIKSLIEKWGIAAMFNKTKRLNASATITEAEVFDILHVTMGYTNPAISKKAVAIKKDAFSVLLTEANSQMINRIFSMPKPQPSFFKDTFYIQQPFDSTKKD